MNLGMETEYRIQAPQHAYRFNALSLWRHRDLRYWSAANQGRLQRGKRAVLNHPIRPRRSRIFHPLRSQEYRQSMHASRNGTYEFRNSSEEFRNGSEAMLKALSSSERAVYNYIAEHGASKTSEIAEALGITPRGTLKLLRKMVEKDLLSVQGETRNREYSLR